MGSSVWLLARLEWNRNKFHFLVVVSETFTMKHLVGNDSEMYHQKPACRTCKWNTIEHVTCYTKTA